MPLMFKALPQHGSTASVPTQALASRLYMQSKALNELNDKGRQATQIGPKDVSQKDAYKDDPKGTQRSQGEAETNKPAKSRWSFFFAQFFVLFFVLFWLLILFFDWISLECKTGLNGTS